MITEVREDQGQATEPAGLEELPELLIMAPDNRHFSSLGLQKYHVSLGMDVSTPRKTRQGVM